MEWWDRGLLAHTSLDHDVPELPAEVEQALTAALTTDPRRGRLVMAQEPMDVGSAGAEADTAMADVGPRVVRSVPGPSEELAAAVWKAATAAAAGQLGPFHLKEARVSGGYYVFTL